MQLSLPALSQGDGETMKHLRPSACRLGQNNHRPPALADKLWSSASQTSDELQLLSSPPAFSSASAPFQGHALFIPTSLQQPTTQQARGPPTYAKNKRNPPTV